jgi:hypothetical protein
MDISSTSGLASYTYTPSSTKSDTSAGLAMLNEANKTQAESAERMIQSVTETTPASQATRDGTGLYVNVTA